jgi:hypothetical protein
VWHVLQSLYDELLAPSSTTSPSNPDALAQLLENQEMFLQFSKQSAKESVLVAQALAQGSAASETSGFEMSAF